MLRVYTFSALIFLKIFHVISQPTNGQILDQTTCASSDLFQTRMDSLERKIEELSTHMYDTKCVVQLRSWGWADSPNTAAYGFIKVNEKKLFGTSLLDGPRNRGVITHILNPSKCTISNFQWFDTVGGTPGAKTTTELIDYLKVLHDGTILIAITDDEPTSGLSPAFDQLQAIGVNVRDVTYRGKFAFVSQIGYPYKTILKKTNSFTEVLELNVTVSLQGPFREDILLQQSSGSR